MTDPLEGWLRRSALRLSSLDDAGEALARLDGKLADRQVVLVGEPDHFIHEKYAYRLSIIRHLFARGFRLVGMEMGRSDAQRIDRYIETGDERWLDRVALYGYRGDLRTDRKPPAKSMFAARNQVAVDAYRAEERRFAHALRVISESRPASTPRLRFFGYDVDMLPGGGYADLDELLAPAASNPVVAELRARLRRVDGESAEAERARLVDAAALVWSRARELTAALSAENFVEVKATLTCLGESLLYAGMTEGEPDAGHLLAALRRREETMFWQVDTALARDS
ncbi:MAG TPA: erythromycin esterase family protein, partial [Casimicrobiaceae bacterium]|nr:erythromycin esterase family protein [Casimicrobiaceae bacterium]